LADKHQPTNRLRGWAGFIELVFIIIFVFGLIIVIFVLISMFDKHYTRLEVKSQTNFWKLVNIFFGQD